MPKGIYPRTLKPPEERFWPKVKKTKTCWLWTGAKDGRGYGDFRLGGRTSKHIKAHVFAYQQLVGPIPEGLTLDHLCRRPLCVRPDHLEPVTNRENTLRGTSPPAQHARKTHCPQGHPYDEVNTYRTSSGHRGCRRCRAAQQAEWWRTHAR
jgi:hypothetical protein